LPDSWVFTLGNSVKYKSEVIGTFSRNVSLCIVKAGASNTLWRFNFDVTFLAKHLQEIIALILNQVSK